MLSTHSALLLLETPRGLNHGTERSKVARRRFVLFDNSRSRDNSETPLSAPRRLWRMTNPWRADTSSSGNKRLVLYTSRPLVRSGAKENRPVGSVIVLRARDDNVLGAKFVPSKKTRSFNRER